MSRGTLDLSPIGNCTVSGLRDVALAGGRAIDQSTVRNTAVLRTVLADTQGASVEVLDFCPRFERHGRTYRPVAFARIVRPLSGSPRIRVRPRPTIRRGEADTQRTWGSKHIRYVGDAITLRLTTNAPVTFIVSERIFRVERPLGFFLGPDESLAEEPQQAVLLSSPWSALR